MKQFLALLLAVLLLTGCGKNSGNSDDFNNGNGMHGNDREEALDDDGPSQLMDTTALVRPTSLRRNVAREVRADGWVYTFMYEHTNGEDPGEDYHIEFTGFNVRYKYSPDYVKKAVYTTDSGRYAELTYSTSLFAGNGPAAEARDMKLIWNTILKDRTPEELLALNPDDYTFESIDKEMFFRLLRQSLTNEPQENGRFEAYWNKDFMNMLVEPEYLDGYKFQVAFLNATGLVDVAYIDVLYKTGDGYTDFVQLSDLAERGEATPEQIQAFEKLQGIAADIMASDSFIAGADSYKDSEIGGLDFSRLYAFLHDIHNNSYQISRRYYEDTYRETVKVDG